ncbi:MAG: methyltransferase domain-containing protein [Alphaproteobacteria bacterium]|nr:methyltransferase domain-containing protein [Alphaproteobacteria bacterium]
MNPNVAKSREPETQLILEQFLPYRLSILSNTVSNTIAREYRELFGLSIPEWRVMAVLGRFSPLTASEVGDRTAMDKVTVSRAVGRLLAQKLVKRETDPNDRRRSILKLTARGVRTHQKIVPIARGRESELAAALTTTERRNLDALLAKLQQRASEIAAEQDYAGPEKDKNMTRLNADGPNAKQIDFWNGPAGDSWTDLMDSQDRMLGPLGEAAMAATDISSGQRVVDIGCGCGTTTLELARRVGPSGHVLGVDVSTPMLERARQRAADVDNHSIDLQNSDAAAHNFTPQSFDRIYSRFGVMFFTDPVAAFSNMRTALKRGGKLAFVCWRPLDLNPWMANTISVATQYLDRLDPPGPDEPGPFAFRDPDRVRGILSDAGFTGIEMTPHDHALAVEADIESSVNKLIQLGPMAQPIAQSTAEIQDQIKADLTASTQPYLTETGVKIDSASWIVRAVNS